MGTLTHRYDDKLQCVRGIENDVQFYMLRIR